MDTTNKQSDTHALLLCSRVFDMHKRLYVHARDEVRIDTQLISVALRLTAAEIAR